MTAAEAREVLIRYNTWRRYDGPLEQTPLHPEPKEIGEAIDVAIEVLPKEDAEDASLEEAARLYAIPNYMRDVDVKYLEEYPYDKIAEAAFIAGAKWMRKKDVEDMYLSDNRHFLKCYEQGKVDMRVEMMKDAVEGEIGYWNQRGLSIRLDKSLERLGYDMDTKVKIIIVKQDNGLHQTTEK